MIQNPSDGGDFADEGRRRQQEMEGREHKRPQLPLDFVVERTGSGIRCRVVLSEEQRPLDSTTEFRVRWAELVDMSTAAGITAGFSRSAVVGTIAVAPDASCIVTDEDKQGGYFYVTAADANYESTYSSPPRFIDGGNGLRGGIPGNVRRFQVSETGVPRDGTTWSQLSFAMEAPEPLGAFWGMQPVFGDYPKLGDLSLGGEKQYSGVAGGSLQFEMLLPIGRRAGTGTVTATSGSPTVTFGGGEDCLTKAKPGDYLEILGVQAQIKSVDSASQVTLGVPAGASVNWAGRDVVALDSYDFIANVRIYARSLSQQQTGSVDLASLPFVDVLLDGLASVPNAPTLTAAHNTGTKTSTIGNINRLYITPVLGVEVRGYRIYRATGAGVAFATSSPIGFVEADHHNVVGLLHFDDTDFTTKQREDNQVFSYYATTVNLRDQQSVESTRVEVGCRLDTPSDTSPVDTSQLNLLFNSFIYGTPLNTVSAADASQDTYSGPLPSGHFRWDTLATGGVTPAGHENETEVTIQSGAGEICRLLQRIGAWDNATVADRRVDKGRNLTLAIFARTTGGSPNGWLILRIPMLDAAGAQIGLYDVKERLVDDSFDYSTNIRIFNGSDMTTDHQLYFATFSPQTIPAGVHFIEVWFDHEGSSNGVNILVTKAILVYGDRVGEWTPVMIGVPFPNPGADPPGEIPDNDGSRVGRIDSP